MSEDMAVVLIVWASIVIPQVISYFVWRRRFVCGGEARIVTAVGESCALCDKCKATTEAHTDRQFAIGAWNRRVTEYRKPKTLSQLEAENAKLRELCKTLHRLADESYVPFEDVNPWVDDFAKATCAMRELGIEVDV